MADEVVASPPSKVTKKRSRERGRMYQVFIGYGEEGKKLYESLEGKKKSNNFKTMASLIQWLLEEKKDCPSPSSSATSGDDRSKQMQTGAQKQAGSTLQILSSCINNFATSTNATACSSSTKSISEETVAALKSRVMDLSLQKSTSSKDDVNVDYEIDYEKVFENSDTDDDEDMDFDLSILKKTNSGFMMSTPRQPSHVNVLNEDIMLANQDNGECNLDDAEESLIQDLVVQQDADNHDAQSCIASNISEGIGYESACYGDLSDERASITEIKSIASTAQLKALLGDRCRHDGCSAKITNVNDKVCGFCLKLEWWCSQGHRGIWYSSKFYSSGLVINYIVQSAILISGGSVNQFKRFCNFVSLGNCCSTTFHVNQRLYVSPAIDQEFHECRNQTVNEVAKISTTLVVAGDGRMDSPGFCASKGSYTLMDYDSKKLLAMECGDKREVNLKSTRLEIHLFMKSIKWLKNVMPDKMITEVCTDAHTAKHELLEPMHHSLDVWHKASKLSSKLAQLAKVTAHKNVSEWIPSIRNHFWFCTQNCDGNELKLRLLWTRILHHIAGNHDYCSHDELDENRRDKIYIDPKSNTMSKLREIILDKRWLKSLKYYTKSRHTGQLEVFHNLILEYCPKRIGYKNDAFVSRHQLAFIDHNSHTGRKQLKNKSGEPIFARRWGKRTKKWYCVPVPEPKKYSYVTDLIAKTLWRRHMDRENTNQKGISRSTTKALKQNIALSEAPTTEELREQHVIRTRMQQYEI